MWYLIIPNKGKVFMILNIVLIKENNEVAYKTSAEKSQGNKYLFLLRKNQDFLSTIVCYVLHVFMEGGRTNVKDYVIEPLCLTLYRRATIIMIGDRRENSDSYV
jgi:hypothetical protein